MADNNIKVNLEVSSNGTTDRELSKSEKLRKSLEGAAAAMGKTGGTAGSRAVAASYTPAMTGQEYGQARGSMGATGASARDFANQAQGLGGLVRLYATYAANLFAATAAFQALSNAMETSNMVRGLDQLGAASGMALGKLSRDFVAATDGAISLREAMEATAKATSAGMSSQQFLLLGDVAKKASQALGVNMSDAVSRLTRGITKLEPELLDELGIFTKVGKATEEYARKVGSAESNLTDFERRQAFANAVLAEGQKKFSEIQIPSNPYAKLLASLKDVGQTILEVINKALVPFINFLSSSPTALMAAIAAIGTMVLKQAIPAIGQYRSELKRAAESAAELAKARSAAADAAIKARDKEILAAKDLKAEAQTQKIDAAQKALEAAQSGRIRKDVRKILEKTPLDITDKDIAKLDKLGATLKNQDNVYVQLSRSIKLARDANLDYIKTAAEVEKRQAKGPGMFSAAGIAAYRAENARQVAASKSIISRVGEVAVESGTITAFKTLGKELSAEKLGAIRTAFTGIAGAVSILGTAIGGVLSVVSRFMGWIGLIIGAYQLLSSTFSKNGAEISAYEDNLKSLEESTKTATDTSKKYGDTLSVESIIARNNALEGTVSAIDRLSSSFVAAKDKASWFDNLTNTIAGWFGSGLEDKFTQQISASITASLSSISDPKLRKQAEEQILGLTGAKAIDELASRLDSLNKKEVRELAAKLPATLGAVRDQADKAALPLKSLKDGFTSLDKAFLDLSNSLLERSPITEFASKLSSQAALLKRAMEDPINSVAVLNDILKDTSQIKMFPPEAQASIIEAAKNMQALQAQASSAQEQIDLANRKLAAATEMERSGVAPEIVLRFKLEAEGLLKSATDTYVAATTKMQQLTSNVGTVLAKTTGESIKLLEAPLARAIAQANIDIAKTLLGFLPKTADTVKLEASLEIQSLDLRKKEISTTRDLITAIQLDRISREKLALQEQLSRPNADANAEEFKQRQQQFRDLEQEEKAYRTPKALVGATDLSIGAQNALRQNAGYLAQLQGIASQQQAARIRGAVGAVGADFEQQRQAQQDALRYYEAEQRAIQSSNEFRELSVEKQQELVSQYVSATEALKAEIELAGLRKDIALQEAVLEQAKLVNAKNIIPLAEQALSRAKAQLATAEETVAATQKSAAQERTRANEEILRAQALAKSTLEVEHQTELAKLQEGLTSKLSDIRKQELQYLLETGQISEEKFRVENAALEQSALLRDRNNQLLQLEAGYLVDVTKLVEEYQKATSEESRALAQARLANRSEQYAEQVSGINTVYEAQKKLLDQQTSLTSRQKSYTEIFKSAFESMADAMVTWAETGKLSGKDLFNSLIADLARYELRLQMTQLYSSAIRPGLVQGLTAIFGGSAANTNVPFSTAQAGYANTGPMGLVYAKGAAFDYSMPVQEFAKGGTFTNSIVNSPTLFKFARGTGLMGEAGPEAIMPLKRDASGNLGVRADSGGGKVDVVVNNYSGASAETRETIDSRGNRKIEVIVGDMAAGELARNGSQSQRAMRSTYGMQPQLIRR